MMNSQQMIMDQLARMSKRKYESSSSDRGEDSDERESDDNDLNDRN